MIKRSLLIDGKFPRSSIRALGNFLLKWIETAKDESFINVIAMYKSRRGSDTARLEIVALDPSRITEHLLRSLLKHRDVRNTPASRRIHKNDKTPRKHGGKSCALTISKGTYSAANMLRCYYGIGKTNSTDVPHNNRPHK